MSRIPQPLPMPAADEIERARTDKSVRERVRKQLWRVRRREEEIARLTAENADCLYGDMGGMDNDCAMDNYVMDDADRYVYLHHILYAHMVHPTRIVQMPRVPLRKYPPHRAQKVIGICCLLLSRCTNCIGWKRGNNLTIARQNVTGLR